MYNKYSLMEMYFIGRLFAVDILQMLEFTMPGLDAIAHYSECCVIVYFDIDIEKSQRVRHVTKELMTDTSGKS